MPAAAANSEPMIVTIDVAAELLVDYIDTDSPVFVWGPPGIGKSDMIRKVAKTMKRGLKDFRVALRDPVDLRGLPATDLKTKTTIWLPPAELPQVARDGDKGVFFLDEMNTGSPQMMNACLGLVLERRIGDYELPSGWVPVAAGNRISDKAMVNRLPTPMKGRFAHITLKADRQAWIKWALVNGIDPMLIALIDHREELLHQMPTEEQQAFPSPRTWEKVNRVLNRPNRLMLVAGHVGIGAATELEGFIEIYKRFPKFDDIIANAKGTPVPKEPNVLNALASGLARRANKDNIVPILVYVDRMPAEFGVRMVTDMTKFTPAMANLRPVTEWVAKHGADMIGN